MKTQHTPGPWTASIGAKGAHINVGNVHSYPLSFGFHWNELDEQKMLEGQANARLIAAAPKLLEACKLVAKWYKMVSHQWPKSLQPTPPIAQIRAAIDEATA